MSLPQVTRFARVLIVDDHAMFAESLMLALDAEDDLSVVAVATSLAAARSRVLDCHPDVVVLDHRLPDGDGVAAIEGLRALRPSMRIVVLTAQGTERLLSAAMSAGATGFVAKTDNIDCLVGAVRAAAVGESVISQTLLMRILPKLGNAEAADDLTDREHEVLVLLAGGLTNKAIAAALQLSPHTVRNHVASICSKLGAHSKLEALAIATRRGLVTP
jgi:DNA-binding NarL/FixJ family response regulator